MRTILILSLVIFMCACGEEKEKKKGPSGEAIKSENPAASSRDSVRVFTLPTPMQIPALLKNSKLPYAPDQMLEIRNIDNTYFNSSIVFGSYLMDLAYASSYSHHQASLDYLAACRNISDDLGLGLTMPEGLLRRFKENINAPDSLGRIILKVYDGGHELLIKQDKEGLGLLMIMGCYIEGLHLTMNQVRPNNLLLFIHLLNQHKNHGLNLRYMLDQYEVPDEVQSEIEQFNKIVETLEKMKIPTIYYLKSGKQSISSIQKEDIETISSSVDAFRQSILQ